MYLGSNFSASKTWGDYSTVSEAAADGAFALRQRLSFLPHLVRVGIDEYQRLGAKANSIPDKSPGFLRALLE